MYVLTSSIYMYFQVNASSKSGNVDLEVQQFHFTAWPDHGIPKCATMMQSFYKCLHIHCKQKLGVPIVVHCR